MTTYIKGKLLSDTTIALYLIHEMKDIFPWTSFHSATDQDVLIVIDEVQGYSRDDLDSITNGRCRVLHVVYPDEALENRKEKKDDNYELVYAETFTYEGIAELLKSRFSEGELRNGKR